MKRLAYPLAVTVTLVGFFYTPALAQQDSTHLDLGYISLNKKFTQTITIRGADLEKMPFTNLNDALRPWLYGTWLQGGTVQYVVDGNPVTNVNAYSIYDIEEIVLVQDAAALMAGGQGQQQLVLVTTRRGKGKQGITVAAQTGLINANSNGVKTETRIYHSYYANAYRNWDKFSAGVSAGWQRDVMPLEKDPGVKINTPYSLQRWRLNGYFDWRPDSHNLIEATINYSPEKQLFDGGDLVSQQNRNAPQKLLIPGVRWHSELLPGLKNDLQGSYLSSTYKESDLGSETVTTPVTGTQKSQLQVNVNDKFWWARDRLAYTIKAGDWRIEPAVTYSYEHVKENQEYFSQTTLVTGSNPFPPPNNVNGSTTAINGKISLLVPSIDLSWKDMLNLQFGSATILSDHSGKNVLPFASASVDVLRMAGANPNNSLRLFGSYAQRNLLFEGGSLAELSRTSSFYYLDLASAGAVNGIPNTLLFGTGAGAIPVVNNNPNPTFWVWTTGATLSLAHDRVRIQYTFEHRNLAGLGAVQVPGGAYAYIERQWHSTLHHFDVRAKVLDQSNLKWETGLNVTLLRNKPDSAGDVQFNPIYGDIAPAGYSPTGGWVNRLQFNRLTAGLDLLYHFHETINYGAPQGTQHVNSVIVPNLYIGYSWNSFSLFAETRGLIRNSKQDVMDSRKFYTIGGKWSL